jgi:hypothetical protein
VGPFPSEEQGESSGQLGVGAAANGINCESEPNTIASLSSSVRPPSADKNFVIDPFQQASQYSLYAEQAPPSDRFEPFPSLWPRNGLQNDSSNVSHQSFLGSQSGVRMASEKSITTTVSDSGLEQQLAHQLTDTVQPEDANHGTFSVIQQADAHANVNQGFSQTHASMSDYMGQANAMSGGLSIQYSQPYEPGAGAYLQQPQPAPLPMGDDMLQVIGSLKSQSYNRNGFSRKTYPFRRPSAYFITSHVMNAL